MIDWKKVLHELPASRRIELGSLLLLVIVVFSYSCMGSRETNVNMASYSTESLLYVQIKPGMTAGEIGEVLQEKGVIDGKYRFWLIAKLNGLENKFKTGNYAFHQHMAAKEVLDMLVKGSSLVVRFTIPEGYNVDEIAAYLAAKGIAGQAEFQRAAKAFAPYGYMTEDSRAKYRAEGFLFPDTYEVRSDVSVGDVLQLMADEFDQKLTPELRQQAADEGLSIHDLITLASLVEKEARFEEDRPVIAQVFLKRLRIGMPLQSDTTIQYLLDTPKEDVSIADTKMESPYNTYQHTGLPPGPIANPGIASIKAVLYPADTDYLYFVADREGKNHYSQNYDEHLAMVEQVR